jgi:hypothetical protein
MKKRIREYENTRETSEQSALVSGTGGLTETGIEFNQQFKRKCCCTCCGYNYEPHKMGINEHDRLNISYIKNHVIKLENLPNWAVSEKDDTIIKKFVTKLAKDCFPLAKFKGNIIFKITDPNDTGVKFHMSPMTLRILCKDGDVKFETRKSVKWRNNEFEFQFEFNRLLQSDLIRISVGHRPFSKCIIHEEINFYEENHHIERYIDPNKKAELKGYQISGKFVYTFPKDPKQIIDIQYINHVYNVGGLMQKLKNIVKWSQRVASLQKIRKIYLDEKNSEKKMNIGYSVASGFMLKKKATAYKVPLRLSNTFYDKKNKMCCCKKKKSKQLSIEEQEVNLKNVVDSDKKIPTGCCGCKKKPKRVLKCQNSGPQQAQVNKQLKQKCGCCCKKMQTVGKEKSSGCCSKKKAPERSIPSEEEDAEF